MATRSASTFGSIVVFRLHDVLDREKLSDVSDFLDPTKATKTYDLKRRHTFAAKLFIASSDAKPLSWVEPLEEEFGTLKVPDSANTNAVLIVTLGKGDNAQHFAFTFGFGRYLLRPGSIQRNYGLKVALNAIYGRSGTGTTSRLRSVDSRTIAANTLRTRRQVDRKTDFETFEVDIERDFLNQITGTPLNEELWGNRLTGSDSLHVTKAVAFHELGRLCKQIEDHSTSLPRQFSWVKKIFAVRDSDLVEKLRGHILDLIKSGETDSIELAPPELVEWENIETFGFSFDSDRRFSDPDVDEYLAALTSKNKLSGLTMNQLMSGHRLFAFDVDGNEAGGWSVFRTLSCQLNFNKKTYVLSEGDFFEVAKDYLTDLNKAIASIEESGLDLPDYNADQEEGFEEGDYNEAVAAGSADFLLLDRQTVTLESRTTPIEICDLMSSEGELVHVKRKLNSSSLSHLFAQGLVSADLLLTSDEFRRVARRRIQAQEHQKGVGNDFSQLISEDEGITPSEFTVVYAIAAKWKNRALADALPFFSKVNLRRQARDLRRMGFGVAYRRIPDLSGGQQ